jgi:hypothetical protein
MLIAIINDSTLINNTDMVKMTGAVGKQNAWHTAPAWNQKPATISFYADKTKVPAHAWVVSMLDNSTQAGALGYHSEDNDVIDAFIFAKPVLDNGGVVLHDPKNNQNLSVASVLSHEVCEMFGDPFANFWADGPTIAQGSEYALELCDAVEGDSYDITLTTGELVSVSNFILPQWFNQEATSKDAPFDYLKKLSRPFSMTPGGYLIVAQGGTVSQVFGERMPMWKQEQKKNAFSRNQKKRK